MNATHLDCHLIINIWPTNVMVMLTVQTLRAHTTVAVKRVTMEVEKTAKVIVIYWLQFKSWGKLKHYIRKPQFIFRYRWMHTWNTQLPCGCQLHQHKRFILLHLSCGILRKWSYLRWWVGSWLSETIILKISLFIMLSKEGKESSLKKALFIVDAVVVL